MQKTCKHRRTVRTSGKPDKIYSARYNFYPPIQVSRVVAFYDKFILIQI